MLLKELLKNKFYILFTLCFIGFGLIISISTSIINYRSEAKDLKKQLVRFAVVDSEEKHHYIKEYLVRNESLLFSITNNPLTEEFIVNKNKSAEFNLNSMFFALTYSNVDIMQLRYINAEGVEKIRVDRNYSSGEVKIIESNSLQDKSNRYYFKEAKLLKENELWHSNIDLNIENKAIVEPIEPTFRVATPLYIKSEFQGIIIANMLMADAIEHITSSSNFDVYILDGEGETIHNPDKINSWSRYLPGKVSAKKIFEHDFYNIINNEDYWGDNLYSFGVGHLFKNSENLKIIFKTKESIINEIINKNRFAALLIALYIFLISIPLSWVVSLIPSRLQNSLRLAYNKIEHQSDILNKNVMITKSDINGNIIEVSEKFLKITGFSEVEIIGSKHSIVAHPDTDTKFHQLMYDSYSKGKNWEGEIKDIKKDGTDLWLHLIITPDYDDQGEIIAFLGISEDISDKKHIESMSTTDSLTGLNNRRILEEKFSTEISLANRLGYIFSVIIIDIDFFKKVNDTYGHLVGDSVLVSLAGILMDNSRDVDFVCRWGGEEFLIICKNRDDSGSYEYADKIRKTVESYSFDVAGHQTISLGVAQYIKGESYDSLVKRADDALFKAKSLGRNRVVSA